LIAAVHHGAAGPRWMNVLIAARDWGCPPWAITGEGDDEHLSWLLRWEFLKSQEVKAERLNAGLSDEE
jgi:hypothetical protein